MLFLAETPTVAPLQIAPADSPISRHDLTEPEQSCWQRFSRHDSLLRLQAEDDFWEASVAIDESAGSQFDLLVDAAQLGAPLPDALACIALTGSGFHGSRRRPWRSLRGNLHFTSFCRLRLDAARCGPALSMLPTLAVTDLLEPRASGRSWIKWINDVYLDDGKVSGSLVSSQVSGEFIESFVLGIGLNIALTPALEPTGFMGRATSLSEAGIAIPLGMAFAELRGRLARRVRQLQQPDGAEALFDDYRRRMGLIGQRVSIYHEDAVSPTEIPVATGRLRAVQPDLSLELEGCPEPPRTGRLVAGAPEPNLH